MHEFSIARNIIEIAEDAARKANCKKISLIKLEVGTLSGIVYEALETALQSAVKNTMLEHAQVRIIRIPALAECDNCHHRFSITDHFEPCPQCENFSHHLLQGDEIKVKTIEGE